ncbi:MAG: cupin domain-containing protein [Candidatus Hermodarchaeota archaeon]
MIVKHYSKVKEEIVTKANSIKTTIRWLITKDDAPTRFATRRFEIKPGGEVGLHDHEEDHHVYVLEGSALFLDNKGNEFKVNKDDVVYIPSNEPHKIINNGNETFTFICVIPYL